MDKLMSTGIIFASEDCAMQNKRVHHFTPKKYLRGFTAPGEKSLIWEYARNGGSFSPGMKRGKNNPALI